MIDVLVNVLDRRRTAGVDDHGMIVSIVSWTMLVLMIFTLLARMTMKLVYARRGNRFGWDDVFLLLAALFSIGQTIAVSIEASAALGQHYPSLSPDNVTIFQKTEYVSCMLYIANMGCARIAVCLLIKSILPGNTAKYTALVFASLTAVWTVSGILVTAFPCSFPNPWQFGPGKKCFELVKFVNYIGITNIVTEVLLVMIPLFVWNLRLSAGRQVSVSFCFLARLAIVAAIGVQLAFFNRYSASYDFTWHYWRTVLCIAVAQNLSVITACLPYLHPFIISIYAGKVQPDSLVFECPTKTGLKQWVHSISHGKFDSLSSASSTRPMKEAGDLEYCRPLATWGLDRSSAHLHSQHFNRFPSSIALPTSSPSPPENVFNRSVHISSSKTPGNSSKELPPIPKTLSQVGCLPLPDWDSESSDRSSAGSAQSRRPKSDYVFEREKVISVPENHELYSREGWREYPPPPMSPKYPPGMSKKYMRK